MDEPKKRIVILGGGFAGLVTARKLLLRGLHAYADITIVDRATMHVYTPWLYEASSGFLSKKNTNEERRELPVSANFPYAHLPGFEHIRFRQGNIERVDAARKIVFLSDGLTIQYDILVIALGAESNYFGIPGLPEHCIPLKSVDNARQIEERVSRMLKKIVPHERVYIVIVGGGAAGVELAGELATSLRALEVKKEIPEGVMKIVILDRSKMLAAFPKALHPKACKRLKKIGVDVREGVAVVEAFADHLTLKLTDGSVVEQPSDLCIWSGGVMPSAISRAMPFSHEPKGRIIVDEAFRVLDADGVFAVGDCAAMINSYTKSPDPQSAEVAIAQAKTLAKNIACYISGEKMYAFPSRKEWDVLVSIGGKYAVGKVYGLTLFGRKAFFIKRLADLRYFVTLLPLFPAIRKWRKGVILYGKNDR